MVWFFFDSEEFFWKLHHLVATLRIMPRPIFLLILNALHKGFQMRYHLFQKFFGKMVEIKEMSFLSTRGMGLMFGNCMWNVLQNYFLLCNYNYLVWLQQQGGALADAGWCLLNKIKETSLNTKYNMQANLKNTWS